MDREEDVLDLSPNQMIRRMFMRCSSVSDVGGLRFALVNDHGWMMTARCEHGVWHETSSSPVDLQQGIEQLYGVFMKEHPQADWGRLDEHT